MRKSDDKDPDTEPIVPMTDLGVEPKGRLESEAKARSPSPSSRAGLSAHRLSLSYEFTSPEAALLATTCTVALGMATGVWPRVEIQGTRFRMSFPAGFELSQRQRAVWADLPGWARRLGGRPVPDDGTWI